MACCPGVISNKPVQYQNVTPDYLQNLQRQQAQYAGQHLGQGATPYGGPLSVGPDPMMLMAANMMSNMMGYGNYNPPSFYGANAFQQGQGGGMPGMSGKMMPPMGGMPGAMGGMGGRSMMGGPQQRPMPPMMGGMGGQGGMPTPYFMNMLQQPRIQPYSQ